MTRTVLTVNAGSTSVKLCRLVDNRYGDTHRVSDGDTPRDLDEALRGPVPDAVLHRVVHGGERTTPTRLDDHEVQALRELTELAPLHQPPALDAIDRCRAAWPEIVQIGCFDTSFHATLPDAACTYALPRRLRDRVRIYGFHGLSHAWSTSRAHAAVPDARRVLVAHLGGGQSLCGTIDGRSVITTMGFSPLDGLVMATRSGSIDPSALLWLTRHAGSDPGELDTVLERDSGLLGLAGTGDMREIVEHAADGDHACRAALDVWTHRFLREVGGCIAVLGGLDVLVFTGGIGENSTAIRQRVIDALSWLEVTIDDSGREFANTDDATAQEYVRDITAPGSAIRTLIVAAREDRQMLREGTDLLGLD